MGGLLVAAGIGGLSSRALPGWLSCILALLEPELAEAAPRGASVSSVSYNWRAIPAVVRPSATRANHQRVPAAICLPASLSAMIFSVVALRQNSVPASMSKP
jgi:hypothetical protein